MVYQDIICQGSTEMCIYSVGTQQKADYTLREKIFKALDEGVLKRGLITIKRTISRLEADTRVQYNIAMNATTGGLKDEGTSDFKEIPKRK